MSRLSEGTAARPAAERARPLTPTRPPGQAGSGEEPDGEAGGGRAAGSPRSAERKTEAGAARPLPKAPGPAGAPAHDRSAKEKGGTQIFPY